MQPDPQDLPIDAEQSWQPAHHDEHYAPLQDCMPDWLTSAAAARRQALRRTAPRLDSKLKAQPARHHDTLKQLNARHWIAQNQVDRQLAKLQDAATFAEPLLLEALRAQFGITDLDVRKTCLRLYTSLSLGAARSWTVSLLDAALHNFEDHETLEGAYEPASAFITKPDQAGRFETLPSLDKTLGIPAFTRLCRELDIGRLYQQHLNEQLGLSDPKVAAALRQKVDASQQAAFKAALQYARMNNDIQEGFARTIEGLLDGLQGLRFNRLPVLCHQLTLLATPLSAIRVFAADLQRSRETTPVVVYIPDDPEHPLKEYASSSEFATELTRQLRSPDYQHFFSRFVAHEQRGHFFSELNRCLSQLTFHSPAPGSGLPAWRSEPIDNPDLHLEASVISGDLWQQLYQSNLDKILNDARAIAVPTARVDQKARWAFWDSVVDIAQTLLNIASFVAMPFVPFLGELMMAYMAFQILDETFEGIVDWAEGQTSKAFEHLMAMTEALLQLGLFVAGGAVIASEYRRVLPREIVQFIDRFKSVRGAKGKKTYWKPDLTPYKQKISLPENSTPNALGLHEHQGKQVLRLDGDHFEVSQDPHSRSYRIEHPSRPDAYKPVLRDNGHGAWHTELEQPLSWEKDTLLQRIGPVVDAIAPAQREQILQVSGCSEDALRQMHVNQEAPPPLLADTLKRFRIDQDLQRFIDQIASDVPEQYLSADPATQLQLLSEAERWPKDQALRLLDSQGQVLWQSSASEYSRLIELRQNQLADGDVLKTLLEQLTENQIGQLLDEEFGNPFKSLDWRTRNLRDTLAQIARAQRSALFESRYRLLEQGADAQVQTLVQSDPPLPLSVAQEMLHNASGREVLQIAQGQLPERLEKLTRLVRQEVLLTRAYEGLALASVEPAQTDVLALHSLETLPGWSHEVRIDVRQGSFDGPELDSIGHANAPIHKVLVRQDGARYQPFDSQGQPLHGTSDLYDSVLRALPDAQRDALKLNIGEAEKLKRLVQEKPLARDALRIALNIQPVEPQVDALRLLGRAGYPRVTPEVLSLKERIRLLYPALSDREIATMLRHLGSNPRAVLSRLTDEYLQLQHELQIWANNPPALHPITGEALDAWQTSAQISNRRALRTQIMRAWRRETAFYDEEEGPASGHIINFSQPILGDLPVLSGDFSHISAVTLDGHSGTTGVNAFLQQFSELRRLALIDFKLPGVPEALSQMQALNDLILSECELVLTPASQVLLSSLRALRFLDLSKNPQLNLPPDIASMPKLYLLELSNTGISHVPEGLQNHPQLSIGVFDDNNISELPDWLFELSSERSDGISFANNPHLSNAAREQIKTHYQRTGQCFEVLVDQADIVQTQELYPNLDKEEASDFVYQLPGTLIEGRAELLRRKAELEQLLVDLREWSQNTPLTHPVSGAPLSAAEISAEQMRRNEFQSTLEDCWRQIPKTDAPEGEYGFASHTAIMGDLPVLTADFSHVPTLYLTSPENFVTRVGGFLERFTKLQELTIRGYRLDDIPQAVFAMPQLSALNLPECAITLTEASADALAGMAQLEMLSLRDNPLGRTPQVSAMSNLALLDLSSTGITEVPTGLLAMGNWTLIDLSSNAISEMPVELMEVDAKHLMNFGNNPFNAQSVERINAYYRRTGNDLGIGGQERLVRR